MMGIYTQGGPVMLPLLLCSIVAVTVIIERFWFWWRINGHPEADGLEQLLAHGRTGNWHQALEGIAARRDCLSIVLAAGITHRDESMSKMMAAIAAEEVARMRRFMPVLDTIITAAPLMGILGTVIGIIVSFDVLGSRGIDDPLAVTSGISQALITTAAGLTIAIFTVFPYNFFNARIAAAVNRIETWATRLETVVAQSAGSEPPCRRMQHETQLANWAPSAGRDITPH